LFTKALTQKGFDVSSLENRLTKLEKATEAEDEEHIERILMKYKIDGVETACRTVAIPRGDGQRGYIGTELFPVDEQWWAERKRNVMVISGDRPIRAVRDEQGRLRPENELRYEGML
jgi:hypothetical protein